MQSGKTREAVTLGAKYIEYRFDFNENYEDLDYTQFAHSVDVPVIFTFRATNQWEMAVIEESRRKKSSSIWWMWNRTTWT